MSRRILRPSVLAAASVLLLVGCEHPPVSTTQGGYRGTGMVEVKNPRTEAVLKAANVVPAPVPAAPADGPRAGEVFQNIKVLNDLSAAEMSRLMIAITAWVAPKEGCTYCHAADNMATDTYRKVVARRMLQMTRHINSDWKDHVKTTGVTCYTCHRGNGIPQYKWFADNGPAVHGMAGNHAGQNLPSLSVGLTSLPLDPYTPYLEQATNVRIESTTPLPTGNKESIKQAEATYGLMIHVSEALGVNCTYCHNSRQFAAWDQSAPPRVTAWYGIRMARDLNTQYLMPLKPVFPPERLGPLGDVAKINCKTCHQGVAKPLYGVSMTKDYPEVVAARPPPPPPAAATEAAPEAGAAPTSAASVPGGA